MIDDIETDGALPLFSFVVSVVVNLSLCVPKLFLALNDAAWSPSRFEEPIVPNTEIGTVNLYVPSERVVLE